MLDQEMHIHKQHLETLRDETRMWYLAQELLGEAQNMTGLSSVARLLQFVRRTALWVVHNLSA